MLLLMLLSVIQASTEFLPVSSSGHLALISGLFQKEDMFIFTAFHLASLIAVIVFLRKEIKSLLSFDKNSLVTVKHIFIAALPCAVIGFFFKDLLEKTFNSRYLIGFCFIFTASVLYLTRKKGGNGVITSKTALIIGLAQILALLPGVSRSGITISTALFLGINRETAARFSFLQLIPLAAGAFLMEAGEGITISAPIAISFFLCAVLSYYFLKLLVYVSRTGNLWKFSGYCFFMGIVAFLIAIFS